MAQHNFDKLNYLNYKYIHYLSIAITQNILAIIDFTKTGVHAIATL